MATTRYRAVALWSATLWLLYCFGSVHSLTLAERVNKKAEAVLGQVTRHSRAIACTRGGYFESISTFTSDNVHSTGLQICCAQGFTVWWEGLETEGEQCADFGLIDGSSKIAGCQVSTAVQSIHYDADTGVNALQGLAWAQFCDTDKCGIKAGALSVGCFNPANQVAQPVAQSHIDKFDCPVGQVVEVIYAHWDQQSIHTIDAVTCKRVYAAVKAEDPIFVSGCTEGGGPEPVDLRCQGTLSDVCGCIKVPAISENPYYGCVMSKVVSSEQEAMPLVTLPGVVKAAPQPHCQSQLGIVRFFPRGTWNHVLNDEDKCLVAYNAQSSGWETCMEDQLLPGQGWRLMTFAVPGIDALESLKFPGSCAVLTAGPTATLCSCSTLAINVKNQQIILSGGSLAELPPAEEEPVAEQVGAPAEAPADDRAEEPVEGPAQEPEQAPAEDQALPPEEYEDPPTQEDAADPAVEPPNDVEDPVPAEPPVDDEAVMPYYEEPQDDFANTPPPDDRDREVDADVNALAGGPSSARRLLDAAQENCPIGEVFSWEAYNTNSVNPHQQFKLYEAATKLVNVVDKAGGIETSKLLLGAPDYGFIMSLSVGEEFDPVRVCNWLRVVCGPEGILQVAFVGGAGTIPPETLSVGMLGLAVVGGSDAAQAEQTPPPEVDSQALAVALHIQSTSMAGRLPCSWGTKNLMYLGIKGNKGLSGPLQSCFAKVATTTPGIIINISDNDAANPFCGSGSPKHPIAKQLPKCSNIENIPTFPDTAVTLTLAKNEDCPSVANKFRTFIETKLGFMMDVTDVSCETGTASVTAPPSRRLLQAGPVVVQADLVGPLADSTMKAALKEDAEGGLYNALVDDIGVSAVTVRAPDLPDGDVATLVPEEAGGGKRSRLIIILIACVAGAVLLFGIVGCICYRARSRNGQQQEVGSLKPNYSATYVSVDASMTQNSADFSGAVPPPDHMAKQQPMHARPSPENRTAFGAPVAPAPGMLPGMPYKGPETIGKHSNAWGTHTQAFAASAAFPDMDQPVPAARKPAMNASTLPVSNGGVVSTLARPAPSSTSPPAGQAVLPLAQSFSGDMDESELFATGDGSMISRSLSKVRTTGNARRSGKEVTPTLPSSANNYPHSEELAKMSSREIHRRMKSPEVTGSRRAKAGDDSESATPGTGGPSSSKHNTPTPTSMPQTDPRSEDQIDRQANPVAERPAIGYLAAAVAATSPAGAIPKRNPSPHGSTNTPGAAHVRDTYAAINSLNPSSGEKAPAVETMGEKNGIQLKAAKRRVAGMSEPGSPDDFSMRVGNTFLMGFTGNLSQDVDGVSQAVKGVETGDMDSPKSQGGVSVSSFKSVSVMSESTTVYTDIGNKDTEGDAMTKLEQVLNRVQRELGGQVGSFRLKGIRHRFTGRSSLVAFADGMWGGEFALKFYSDLEAAQTEFAIYRQAEDLHMALPPVQEIEDNTGGVLRLKDGTPLPPYLAMPRGLPLPDWYAMHRPRQVATLAMLAQLLYRLDKLHVSGYCHNDIKPANMVLLDGGNKKKPEWHIVDFTNMSQIGSNTRARYTLEYASPEVVRAVGAMRAHYVTCQPSMDIWSMGVICFEVLTSKPFFPMDYNREAMKDGLIGLEPLPVEEEPALFSRIPAEGKLRATVKMMVARDLDKRPSAATVGKAVALCLKELTGEEPEPLDMSPVSSLLDQSTTGI